MKHFKEYDKFIHRLEDIEMNLDVSEDDITVLMMVNVRGALFRYVKYHCRFNDMIINNYYDGIGLNVAIMNTCSKIFNEALKILYHCKGNFIGSKKFKTCEDIIKSNNLSKFVAHDRKLFVKYLYESIDTILGEYAGYPNVMYTSMDMALNPEKYNK